MPWVRRATVSRASAPQTFLRRGVLGTQRAAAAPGASCPVAATERLSLVASEGVSLLRGIAGKGVVSLRRLVDEDFALAVALK